MTGEPGGRSRPVQDHRHNLVGRTVARGGACGNIDAPAAVELAGVAAEILHQPFIVTEQRLRQPAQTSRMRMPIHHLDVLVGHIMAPYQPVIPSP
ncbi:hypothetical protein D3C81_1937160 [compost metagenome]